MSAPRRRCPAILGVALLVAVGCGACAKGDQVGRVVSGAVVLVGERTDVTGAPLGELRLTQTTGFPVFLYQGGQVIASTATSDGRFQLFVPNGRSAEVRIRVIGPLEDALPIAAGQAGDVGTLELRSTSNVRAWPNPDCACSPPDSLLRAAVSSSVAGPVCVRLRNVAGTNVRTLHSGMLAAPTVTLAPIEMVDDAGDALPAGPYWITLDATGACGTGPSSGPDSLYGATLFSYTP